MKRKKPLFLLLGLIAAVAAGVWYYYSRSASGAVNEKELITVQKVDFPRIERWAEDR